MIQIGTVIQGYKVYGICDKYCIARNISPRTADSWVVWTINNNQKGVHTGRYFSNQMGICKSCVLMVSGQCKY